MNSPEPEPSALGISVAFKEWASVVRAIETGRQDVIFRKGGIAEDGRGFEASHDRFFLFPTYFHQQRAGLRDEYAPLFDEVMSARPPAGHLAVTSWVEVKRSSIVERESDLVLLASRHVYKPHVLVERFQGRHGKALYAMEIGVHVLREPLELPLLDVYAGCRSWVELEFSGAR
jgi:hypothetical protein